MGHAAGRPLGQEAAVAGPVHDIAFSPDGLFLACACAAQIAIIDIKHYKVRVIKTKAPITAIVYSPDGARLVTGGTDEPCESLQFSEDYDTLLAGFENRARVWNVK